MWSAGTWAQDDTAGPVAEATEESHANATKHGSSRVELTQGRSALWDAQLEDGRGGGAPTSRWGKVAPGFASSQVSKEGGENEMRRSTKKWQVWKDAASEVDEEKQKWHNYHTTVRERKARQAGSGRVYRGGMTPFWMGYEMLLCFLMISALVLLLYVAMYLQPAQAPVERRFDVYDSLKAPANPFLLQREAVRDQSTPSDDTPIPRPGKPYRWQVSGEDTSGLKEVNKQRMILGKMSQYMIAYSLLQGGALLLLMARLVSQVSFQPQLSVIAGTFKAALNDLIHFVIILCVLAAMIGSALHVVFGADFNEFMTPSNAMYTVFSGIGTEADAERTADQTQFFLKEGRSDSSSNVARRGLAWVFIIIQPLIFRFMMVMVMSIVAWPYAAFSMGARGEPTMLQDLKDMLRWGWQTWKQGNPANKDLDDLLERLLHGHGGFLLRSYNISKFMRRASDDSDNPLHEMLHSREESCVHPASHFPPHTSGKRLDFRSPPTALLQRAPELVRSAGKLIRPSTVHPSPPSLEQAAHLKPKSEGSHQHLNHKLGKPDTDPSHLGSSDRPSTETKDSGSSGSSKQEHLILGKLGHKSMAVGPPKLGLAGPDERLLLYPPAAAVPSHHSSPPCGSPESSREGILILPGSNRFGHSAAKYNAKGCRSSLHSDEHAPQRRGSGSSSSSPGSSDFLDSGSEDPEPAAHVLTQELHAAQPTILPPNSSSGFQAALQQLSLALKGWHPWEHLPLLRAHALTDSKHPSSKEALTYESLCTLMRACAPMSWGLSTEQELEQLLSLALLLQRHGELPSPAAHAPPQRSHSVNASKPERACRRAHGDADEGGSDSNGDEHSGAPLRQAAPAATPAAAAAAAAAAARRCM